VVCVCVSVSVWLALLTLEVQIYTLEEITDTVAHLAFLHPTYVDVPVSVLRTFAQATQRFVRRPR